MTIRSRLQLIVLSTALVFSSLIAVNGWWQMQFGALHGQLNLVTELNHTLFLRGQIRDEYFLYREARAVEQWRLLNGKVDGYLQRLSSAFGNSEQATVVEGMLVVQQRNGRLFPQLLAHDNGDTTRAASTSDLRERIITQMMNSAHAQYQGGLALSATMNERLARYQRRSLVFGSFALLLLGLLIAGMGLIIKRSITRPLERFQQGVAVVAQGALAHKIALNTRDEIGRLAEAFDAMTARLQEITVSRDELTAEIGRRTRTEALLQQANADLERSNRELEQFAYVASHDLQEPLRMVASYTQLLAQRYEGQLDEKARKYIDYAVDGAARMQRLINDLLVFSRIGTRGSPLELTDAQTTLDEALHNLSAAIAASRAIVTADKLPTLRAAPHQLTLVFQNLIGNAVKFRGEQEPRVHVGVAEAGGEWVFSVKDNGIGIEAQYAERIFVIFQRLHTREEYPGTGIGLAICKRIVERHGGRIWFESEPLQGSTFFFSIPK